jgi:hypothetical protein
VAVREAPPAEVGTPVRGASVVRARRRRLRRARPGRADLSSSAASPSAENLPLERRRRPLRSADRRAISTRAAAGATLGIVPLRPEGLR